VTPLNALLYLVISGQAFFFGAGLMGLGLAMEGRLARRRDRLGQRVAGVALLVGAFFVALSSTPLPVWFYGLGGLGLGGYLVWLSRPPDEGRRRATRLALAVIVLAGVMAEGRHHVRGPLQGRPQKAVYVLGDSISAGIVQPGVVPYPQLLQKQHGVRVTNLAVSGCTVQGATSALDQIRDPAGLILVEIGGIDLFQNRPSAEFARDLEALLRQAATPERTVVMLELPLPPFSWGYGRVQRRLARQYGVILVPKRVFAGVLGTPGATDPDDRIHLTRSGQALMAERLWPWLRPNVS
jgi:lysophospholipase L1-like esterase